MDAEVELLLLCCRNSQWSDLLGCSALSPSLEISSVQGVKPSDSVHHCVKPYLLAPPGSAMTLSLNLAQQKSHRAGDGNRWCLGVPLTWKRLSDGPQVSTPIPPPIVVVEWVFLARTG